MNSILKKYYKIEECKSFNINDKCKLTEVESMDRYTEYMGNKDTIHVGKLDKFEYIKLGDILKSKKNNDYYSFYYKNQNRTTFDTYDKFSSIIRLKWLVQMRIIYANTIHYNPRNILYISPGYSKELINKYKYDGANPRINIYADLRCFITKLLFNNYQNINQYNYVIYDSHKNYKDTMSDDGSDDRSDTGKTLFKNEYKCMNFHTPYVNNKIVSTINNDYLTKVDLLFCNNIIRRRDSIQNIKRKIIYIIYIGLQLLLEGGSLVVEIDMLLYKKDNKYLTDIINILAIYFEDVSYFINNLEQGYLKGTLLVIAKKFNNKGGVDVVGKYIKSKYKMDLSKHYSSYNKDILQSLGNVFDYLKNTTTTLIEVTDYYKSLSLTCKNKLYDILDKPRYKIAQDIVKKYNISPTIDIKYHSALLSHIRENKPGNILIYGPVLKDIRDAVTIGNEYNFKSGNIYEFESILNINIMFDFVYMNFTCKDNGKFILSYIVKILNPGAYILFKNECKYLKDYSQLKKSKAFTIRGSKYLLYNLAPVEEVFDSYSDSPM